MRTLDRARKYAYLNELSTPELENILRADLASSGEGDTDMVLYIMEVIEQREGGKSPENAADAERAREEFYRIYNTPEGIGQSLYATEDQDDSVLPNKAKNTKVIPLLTDSVHKSATFSRRFRRVRRIGLIAAITVTVMLGAMVVAHAAGVDVFGAMARWTDDVFSLGTIRYQSAVDVPNDTTATTPPQAPADEKPRINSEYTSIQDALDACGITEVAAPTWIPEGYSFDGVDILYDPGGAFWILSGGYIKENCAVTIEIEYYDDEPRGQIEKTDAPVETFTINGITVYLIENINNNAAVWATEHYAYFIGCGGDKDNVRKMAISAIENVKYASIQDALDACGITEVAAPTWIPEGFSFDNVGVLYKPDGAFWILSGAYLNGIDALNIAIERYDDEPHMQIEKTDASVETFTMNGITVYLLENINSNIATWATEHYAYYIDCGGDKDNVRKMAISAIENVKDVPHDSISEPGTNSIDNKTEYGSLQEALEAYGITEVSEPSWIPEEYIFSNILIICWPDGTPWQLSAEYFNGTSPLHIEIGCYQDEPCIQVEKNDTPVETFITNGITVYLCENLNNNMAAWATEHYECYISGAVETSVLQQMVLSIYNDVQ